MALRRRLFNMLKLKAGAREAYASKTRVWICASNFPDLDKEAT